MASYRSLLLLITSFMAFSILPSLASILNSKNSTISASPVIVNFPPVFPFQELSPDIAPLFPTPGGVMQPNGSSFPTISDPSPPSPDELTAPGPESAFSPSGSLPASSAAVGTVLGSMKLVLFFMVLTLRLFSLF